MYPGLPGQRGYNLRRTKARWSGAYLIALANSQSADDQVQRTRTAVNRDSIANPSIVSNRVTKLFQFRAESKVRGLENPNDGFDFSLCNIRLR